jgi:hypothetical protein
VKRILPFLLMVSGVGLAQTPFDRYMGSVKAHRSEPRFTKAALACGFDPSRAQAVYGATVGDTLHRTPNFPKGVYNLESDFFWTAALWSQDGQPRLLDVWSVDDSVIFETNAIVCLDTEGKPSKMQVTNWSIPIEPNAAGWSYRQSILLNASGRIIQRSGSFLDVELSKTIAKPHLDADDEKSYAWVPDRSMLLGAITKLKETGKK